MDVLAYILLTSFKNSLRKLVRKPGKLVLYLIVLGAMVAVLVLSLFTKANLEEVIPLPFFTGIMFLFVAFFLCVSVIQGLSSGSAIFEMQDVNLLFTAPVDSRKILLYGIVRILKTAFFASFFILFNSNTLVLFGIDVSGLFLVFVAFLLSVLVDTIATLVIYCTTNGRPARKRAVRVLLLMMFLPLAVQAFILYGQGTDMMAFIGALTASPYLGFIPVAGWTAAGLSAAFSGDGGGCLLYFGLDVLLGLALTAFILFTNPDYYEDVLVATETAYERTRAAAEGNISYAERPSRSVRVAHTGITGLGARAFLGKHLREDFRQSRLGLLGTASLIVVACALMAAFFIRDLAIVIQILMWAQIFLIGTGRGLKELYSHYIYLVPEPPFTKVVWSNLEITLRTLVEGVLIFGLGGLLAQADALTMVLCIAIYTLFAFLLLGANYVIIRFTGANVTAGILILVYMVEVLLLMAPGLALGFGALALTGSGFMFGLVLAVWELVAGAACFALSRGVLHNCDMPVIRLEK
ncbi:MAG: putative ABC exporter domain-containing protein [Coriobacteriaceae bacterium]|jgi:hypothetical protein|nr:putative ABC exporter domain-containing protein [Coriobacteriaceae bacterium]